MGGGASGSNSSGLGLEGGVVFGLPGSETSINLDSIFSHSQPLTAQNQPPILSLKPIQALIQGDKAPTHARTCCYAFQFRNRDDLPKLAEFVKEKVEFTQKLYQSNTSRSVILQKQPAYFFGQDGLLWLVFNSQSTAIKRWHCLGESLNCHCFRAVSPHYTVRNGTRGMENVVANFGLSGVERDALYMSTTIDIGFKKLEVSISFRLKRLLYSFLTRNRVYAAHAKEAKDCHASDRDGG